MESMLDHLLLRGYDSSLYPTQWIGDNTLTVPLFTLDRRLTGMQTYTRGAEKKTKDPSKARYFTRSFGLQPLWGTELPMQGSNTIFLTESVFKSATLHMLGYNSWTTLNATISKDLRKQLKLLGPRIICWGDDDPAGHKFSRLMGEGLVSKDIDELTIDEVITLAEGAIHGNSL